MQPDHSTEQPIYATIVADDSELAFHKVGSDGISKWVVTPKSVSGAQETPSIIAARLSAVDYALHLEEQLPWPCKIISLYAPQNPTIRDGVTEATRWRYYGWQNGYRMFGKHGEYVDKFLRDLTLEVELDIPTIWKLDSNLIILLYKLPQRLGLQGFTQIEDDQASTAQRLIELTYKAHPKETQLARSLASRTLDPLLAVLPDDVIFGARHMLYLVANLAVAYGDAANEFIDLYVKSIQCGNVPYTVRGELLQSYTTFIAIPGAALGEVEDGTMYMMHRPTLSAVLTPTVTTSESVIT